MTDGACRGMNPELFVPERGGYAAATVRYAKTVCRTCPVATPCLEYALEADALPNRQRLLGIWGGTSPDERKKIRARRLRWGQVA
jgi:WhiB family redox-sensing transcriptional regulator